MKNRRKHILLKPLHQTSLTVLLIRSMNHPTEDGQAQTLTFFLSNLDLLLCISDDKGEALVNNYHHYITLTDSTLLGNKMTSKSLITSLLIQCVGVYTSVNNAVFLSKKL